MLHFGLQMRKTQCNLQKLVDLLVKQLDSMQVKWPHINLNSYMNA